SGRSATLSYTSATCCGPTSASTTCTPPSARSPRATGGLVHWIAPTRRDDRSGDGICGSRPWPPQFWSSLPFTRQNPKSQIRNLFDDATIGAMKFTKMHGIGNDYVYVNGFEQEVADPAAVARRISDRHYGVGSDGLILILPPAHPQNADVRMRTFNADGSEGEMCG